MRAALVCLAAMSICAAAGCKKKNDTNAVAGSGGVTSVPGTSGTTAAGTSGTTATGASGTQSSSAGSISMTGSSGSKSGASGSPATGSSGTTAGASGMSAGASGAGGTATAGSSGAAGASGSGSVDVDQCLADVMAAGTTITDCERCLCQPDNCQAVLAPLKGDDKANAVVNCSKANNCSGQCCLCATDGKGDMCDMLGGNFATGKCANEILTAAGAMPGGDLTTNATAVGMYCTEMSTDTTNPCTKATLLAKCASDKCASMCPSASCP